jgi:hypothetical protein
VFVGATSNIFSTSARNYSYTCKYVEWISSTNGTVSLVFQLRNDPAKWYIDDVSVLNTTTEMLINGGFETGSFTPGWTKSMPNGMCGGGSTSAQVNSSSCRTGTYCLNDGCLGVTDQISQSFVVITGHSYFVSFWLVSDATGFGTVSVSVTLS